MAWEWLAPTGTVVGASITAGFGGWWGGRRSRKDQEAQQNFERERAITAHARERVDDAIAALRFLRRHHEEVASWKGPLPAGTLDEVRAQYEVLGRAIEYLGDPAVRFDIGVVHKVLGSLATFGSLNDLGVHRAAELVQVACDAGIGALGQYMRGEPRVASADLVRLHQIYDSSALAFAAIQEENAAYEAAVARGEVPERGAEPS
jgi:hypothetical protein